VGEVCENQRMSQRRIVFFARNAIVHELGGSMTVANNLLEVLRGHGAEITVCVLSAYSRSPRLFFKENVSLPAGVKLVVPGFLRCGKWYVNPLSPRAWARMICRVTRRRSFPGQLCRAIQTIFGDRLNVDAWDLTTPTADEAAALVRELERTDPSTVMVNYANLGPLLRLPQMAGRKRVIVMHDLLSARIAKFIASGIALDCPYLAEETELGWLNEADYVLAAQRSEADSIAAKVKVQVLVQPIVIPIHHGTHPADPFRCLFVGTNIVPNSTGIRWFLEKVWPQVLRAQPQAVLHIAGSVCMGLDDSYPKVRLLGVLTSLDEEMERAGVCVIPLQVGSGIKVKLLEALAFGKACVSTPIGVQGLEPWAPGAIEVASGPDEFAAAVLRLMTDDALRGEREQAAVELMRRHFSAESDAARAFAEKVLEG